MQYAPIYAPIISRSAASQIIGCPLPFCIGWYAPVPHSNPEVPPEVLVIDTEAKHETELTSSKCCIQTPSALLNIVNGHSTERSILHQLSLAIDDTIYSAAGTENVDLMVSNILQTFLLQVLQCVEKCSFNCYSVNTMETTEPVDRNTLFDELGYCTLTAAAISKVYSMDTEVFLHTLCRTQTLSNYISSANSKSRDCKS